MGNLFIMGQRAKISEEIWETVEEDFNGIKLVILLSLLFYPLPQGLQDSVKNEIREFDSFAYASWDEALGVCLLIFFISK